MITKFSSFRILQAYFTIVSKNPYFVTAFLFAMLLVFRQFVATNLGVAIEEKNINLLKIKGNITKKTPD